MKGIERCQRHDRFAEGDEEREAGRMRMMQRDVVIAQRERKQRLVPVPQRARHRRPTRDRHDDRQQPRRDAFLSRQRLQRAGSHDNFSSCSPSSRVSSEPLRVAGTTVALVTIRNSFVPFCDRTRNRRFIVDVEATKRSSVCPFQRNSSVGGVARNSAGSENSSDNTPPPCIGGKSTTPSFFIQRHDPAPSDSSSNQPSANRDNADARPTEASKLRRRMTFHNVVCGRTKLWLPSRTCQSTTHAS